MMKRRVQARVFRPQPEVLETRQLLSKVLHGQDVDGDTWTLRMIGPGQIKVVNQNDPATDQPVPLGDPGLINTIDTYGTASASSRLVGTVKKGANGDGKVFFQALTVNGTREQSNLKIFGIHAIDIPDFWLGRTSVDPPATGDSAGKIDAPQGVNTLRFGGVDTTFTPPDGTPLNTDGKSESFDITLGLPETVGTSVIVDKIITDGQPAAGTTAQTQDDVNITVLGRLNQFIANEIQGNPALTASSFLGGVGTVLLSRADTTDVNPLGTGVTGQIGFVKVGGNATNFYTQTNSRIRNYFVGGETHNVNVIAPTGLRQVLFGKGMDQATLVANQIFLLHANRGALDSRVQTTNQIGQVLIGGDVANSFILSGYVLDTNNIDDPTKLPQAKLGGAIGDVLVAGNITNSIFAASVEPVQDGAAINATDSLRLAGGNISAKVEGLIDNSVVTPDQPDQAFFAQSVHVSRGPIIPPNVPEAPYPHAGAPPHGPRIARDLQPNDPELRQRIANLYAPPPTTTGTSASKATSINPNAADTANTGTDPAGSGSGTGSGTGTGTGTGTDTGQTGGTTPSGQG